MKKFVIIVLVLVFCVSLYKCTSKNKEPDMSFHGQLSEAFNYLWKELAPKETFVLEEEFNVDEINNKLTQLKNLSENKNFTEEERRFALTVYNFMAFTSELRLNKGKVAGTYTAIADKFSYMYYGLADELAISYNSRSHSISDESYKFAAEMAEIAKNVKSVGYY